MRILLAILLFFPAIAHAECVEQVPCTLDDRSYHVKVPDDWDGVTPLPVLLHFHGWNRQGTLIVKHARISGATRERGVLLLAPNGRHKTWDFWSSETADVPFATAVLEDAAKRYPIDRNQVFVSGYSYGSAMAWRYACEAGNHVTALLAVAGSINQTERCPEAPFEIRHVHGLSDKVMDFPMGPGGDTHYPVALWRQKKGCGTAEDLGQWRVTEHDLFSRYQWACDDGTVVLDLHDRGHFIPRGWIARQLDELLDLPASPKA